MNDDMIPNDVTVLVDIQNIYYGALNHPSGGKIDYKKLMDFVKQQIDRELTLYFKRKYSDLPYPLGIPGCHELVPYAGEYNWNAYVVQTPRYNGVYLFALLSKLGYTLREVRYPSDLDEDDDWKGGVVAQMQMDYVQRAPQSRAMVVVTGNGGMAPAFEASRDNWPYIPRYLVTFEHTMHSAFEDKDDIITNILYLDERVLR